MRFAKWFCLFVVFSMVAACSSPKSEAEKYLHKVEKAKGREYVQICTAAAYNAVGEVWAPINGGTMTQNNYETQIDAPPADFKHTGGYEDYLKSKEYHEKSLKEMTENHTTSGRTMSRMEERGNVAQEKAQLLDLDTGIQKREAEYNKEQQDRYNNDQQKRIFYKRFAKLVFERHAEKDQQLASYLGLISYAQVLLGE